MMRAELRVWVVACLVVTGCSVKGRELSAAELGLPRAGRAPKERCVAPDDANTAPVDVAQLVELIQALPKPLTLPCLLETLARPISMHASQSVFSNQPAQGARSPRIFMFYDSLEMAVVPIGTGSRLLELGEQGDDKKSVKAALEFPITDDISVDTPFERILYDQERSTCGFCHRGEEPAPDASSPLAFRSQILRPAEREGVPLERLTLERERCNPDAEPDRCAILDALFYDEVVEQGFDVELDTFL